MKRTIKIHIAGQQYVLRSDADDGYVQSLAEFVNARINVLKGNRQVATQSDVVLAALKLADELQHERQVQAQLRAGAREQVQRMLVRLNAYIDRPEAAKSSEMGFIEKAPSARPRRRSVPSSPKAGPAASAARAADRSRGLR